MRQPLNAWDAQEATVSNVRNGDSLNIAAPAIQFRSVGKVFRDGTVALRDVSLVVQPGEFVSIVGPSGCGKSTLLRIASNLTAVTTGTIECPSPRDIGYVFQDPTLLPWRTVEGNVKLPCELRGMARREQDKIAQEVLEVVGLHGFEKHRPWALSGGMRMRVSLARSLAMKPKLFLFDEPFGALDEITRDRLNDELLRLFVDKQFAAIFVTHSVSEAVYLSNRVLVMSARPGRIRDVFDVPLPFPRREDQRFDAQYVEVAGAVSKALRKGTDEHAHGY